jgi:hypothetical protein
MVGRSGRVEPPGLLLALLVDLRAGGGSITELPRASADGLPEAAGRHSRPALVLDRFTAGLRQQPGMVERIESAAVESSEGQPHDDVALLGLRLARAARG